MSLLVLAEKPSVASSISAVLGATKRGDGCFHGSNYYVSWCYGHLVDLADPAAYGDQYKRWSRAALPILPEKWKYTASAGKKKQLEVISSLINSPDVDGIICATDAGREGELIFRLVYDYCKCSKPVQRLWISSLEDSAIRDGFAKLRPGSDFDNLYNTALCRSQADWIVGINGTRLFSLLYGPTLNVGRVQSPTLAMIVEREKAIAAFVQESFYTPEIDCGGFTAAAERQSDAEIAETICSTSDGTDASVLSVEKARKTTTPPRLYDLTSLQRDANRISGYTAQQTLDYLQSLYEAKLTTYPRTDSQYLTEDMGDTAKAVVTAIMEVFPFADGLSFVPDISRVTDNAKVSDHHAIIPTLEIAKKDLSTLPSGERNVLMLIAPRLLCAAAPVHSFETTTAVLECGGYLFTAKGKTVLDDGWRAINPAFREDEDSAALPELAEGQVFRSVAASVREGKTKPPARFTEGTLLLSMETAGLGTPATRAGIIEKLIKSGMIERQKKNLVPTAKGMALIAVLPEDIKSPALTADWEESLKMVERGELSGKKFMAGINALVSSLVAANAAPIPEMVSLFASMQNAGNGGTKGKVVGRCPRCSSDVTESPKGFFCSSGSCKFVLWKDSRFWAAKRKELTTDVVSALLKEGRVFFSDLFSEKTGKTYAALILLEDKDGKTNYRLDFNGRDAK